MNQSENSKGFPLIGDKFPDMEVQTTHGMDQVFSHIKWVQWIKEKLKVNIIFPIIADYGKVANSLGMIHPSKGLNTVRAVFVVDPKGIIRLILYYPQEIGRFINEILRAVKALQTADREGVAIPANWPNNKLIGKQVIIPPAKDEETAKQRTEEFSCYDWWFCYKSLEE